MEGLEADPRCGRDRYLDSLACVVFVALKLVVEALYPELMCSPTSALVIFHGLVQRWGYH